MKTPLLSYRDVLIKLEETIRPLPTCRVNWKDALGCTLAEDIYAVEDMPSFSNSAMDGYAVIADDIKSASPDSPIILDIIEDIYADKDLPKQSVQVGQAAKIMTGAPIPNGADTVVKIEDTRHHDNHKVEILCPSAIGENIRPKGEEISIDDTLIPSGTRISTIERGLLALQGITKVSVRKPPKVALLVTGDELVEPDEQATGGQIRNVNTYTLMAELQKFRCPVVNLGIGGDEPERLRALLEKGIEEADVLITSGGVSAGEKDYLPGILHQLGMRQIFHKAAIKPGKPILFGVIDDCYILGLPGNVVSVLTSFHLIVKPALRLLCGRKDWRNQNWYARMGVLMHNPVDRTHFVRCRLSHTPTGLPLALPIGKQSSGMLTSMLGAEGFAMLPADIDTIGEFEEIEFIPIQED